MEHLKRINKLWTSDTLFLREFLMVPSLDEVEEAKDGSSIAQLVLEKDVKANSLPDVLHESLTSSSSSGTCSRPGSAILQASAGYDGTSPTVSTASEKSLHDYLGDLDLQINEARSKAQKLQNSR